MEDGSGSYDLIMPGFKKLASLRGDKDYYIWAPMNGNWEKLGTQVVLPAEAEGKYRAQDDGTIAIDDRTITELTLTLPAALVDTMLATGASLEITYLKLCEEGKPYHTHLVCPIASAYAVEYLQMHLPEDGITLWVAAIDEELTSRSYIVPGLGDAGDLAYGVKK